MALQRALGASGVAVVDFGASRNPPKDPPYRKMGGGKGPQKRSNFPACVFCDHCVWFAIADTLLSFLWECGASFCAAVGCMLGDYGVWHCRQQYCYYFD